MKTPKFLTKLAARLTPKPRKRYQAAVRAARPAQVEQYDDDDQPTTKLSSAFIVVLILHVVAVGGIYAFNSIKASRRNQEQAQIAPAANPANVTDAQKTASDLQNGNASAKPAATAGKPAAANPAAPRIAVAHPDAAASAPAATSPATTKPGVKTYQIKAGDNLTKIAFAFRITSADLLAANNMKPTDILKVGQTLSIPEPKSPVKPQAADAKKAGAPATVAPVADIAPTTTTPGLYFVKKGDTAHSIAKNYGISVDELLKVNKISDPKKLQLNQAIKLPMRKS